MYICQYFAEFFLEKETLLIEFVDKIIKRILYSINSFSNIIQFVRQCARMCGSRRGTQDAVCMLVT